MCTVLCRCAAATALTVGLGFVVAPAVAQAAPAQTSCGAQCVVLSAPASPLLADTLLSNALAKVGRGGTVQLRPGLFRLARPLHVPSNRHLTGPASAVLLPDRTNLAAFGYGFVLDPGPEKSTNVHIDGVSINGNRVPVDRVGASAPARAASAGGIKVGRGWEVSNVHISNVGYMKLWVYKVSNVTLSSNTFDDKVPDMSNGFDIIGGGQSSNIRVLNNVFGPNMRGNALDFVTGSNIVISNNTMYGRPGANHSVFLEGTTNAVVDSNRLTFSSITAQSNTAYRKQVVRNPARVQMVGNTITDAPSQAISVRYDAGLPGGSNTVANNTIVRPGTAGVIVFAASTGLAKTPDSVMSNRVTDPFSASPSPWNCGYGITRPAGIVIGVANGATVGANVVSDTRTPVRAETAIMFGLVSSRRVEMIYTVPSPNVAVGFSTTQATLR